MAFPHIALFGRLRRVFGEHKAAFVVSTVAGLLVALIIWLVTYWQGRPGFSPYVAVVVSQKAIDFPIPKEFLEGFQNAANSETIETRNRRRVDVQIREDYGSVEEARRIAADLVHDPNCILVIGNSNSTVTATTLDVFLHDKNPPSYILPIATESNLVGKAKKGGHDAVLRMVPDNANQAIVIQQLIKTLSPQQRIAIYSDEENPTYSLDLSRSIASTVRDKGGAPIIEQMIGPTNSIFTSLPVWHGHTPPQLIVYVGVAHHGFLLIDQIRALDIRAPIIFTDGVMVNQLTRYIGRLPNKAFVLSPVSSPHSDKSLPTYEPIGRDAFNLARILIGNCADCTRAELRKVVAGVKGQNVLANGDAGAYEFDLEGNNKSMQYTIYEITGGSPQRFSLP
jgi:ABC-type branched-subunit amino acid transport system substrate-binding protein